MLHVLQVTHGKPGFEAVHVDLMQCNIRIIPTYHSRKTVPVR